MCNISECPSKKNYNDSEFCYRHRGHINKKIQSEIVSSNIVSEPEQIPEVDMTPRVNSSENNTVPDKIDVNTDVYQYEDLSESELNNCPVNVTDKTTFFKSIGCILGNVKLIFNDNGKKKIERMSKWKDLTKSEEIIGSSFLIKTGTTITAFDIDIKPEFNGSTNLLDAGINFDNYLDECIKVRTQSGGNHYLFKYDHRFETGANCFGIKGFDIRNDNGIIFAGDRYDIVSVGKNFKTSKCLSEIFLKLKAYKIKNNVLEEQSYTKVVCPKAKSSQLESKDSCFQAIETNREYNEKYYELLSLLDDKWFNDHDKWIKPIYALKNASDIDNKSALDTILYLLDERSNASNPAETRRVFALDNSTKRFNIGSIIAELKRTRLEDWKLWNNKWFPKEPKDDKKKTPLDILKEKLIEIVRDKYKREFQTGVIYENILPYYYVRKYDDPAEFLNVIFANEPMFHTCKSQDHQQLLYFIKNIINPDFEFIKLDYNYIGFRNGIYNLSNASFILTTDISENIQVRTYIDSEFDIDNDYAPLLDQYLKFQFDTETIEFIYFMIGRLMTKLNDKFDFMVLLYGEGGSGKSLLMNLLKYSFASDQVGILSNSHQEQFGLSEYSKKQILCCDDMDNIAKTLPKADFLSMATRGSVQCPVKGKGSIPMPDWNIGTIINGNKLPNYKDEAGEVVRRFMVAYFENIVPEESKNTNLETEIKDQEFGVFLHRCRSTYIKFCAKYKNKCIESFCPISFIDNRNLLRMATNNTYQFISEKCMYSEGSSLTVPQLNKALKEYIQNKYSMNQTPKDTINVANLMLVDNRFIGKKINICKSCRQAHIKGCCRAYNRINKSKSHIISNITFSYKADEEE